MHSCTSEARTERKSLPEIREEQTWCYPRKYIYFKTCTLYTAQWLLHKSRVIIWQKSNISLGAVICLFLLFPIVRCSCCYGPFSFWGVFQSLSVCQVSITSCKLSKGNNRKPQCQAQTHHEILILGRWHQSSAVGFHFTWSIIKLLWFMFSPNFCTYSAPKPNNDIAAMKSTEYHCISWGSATGPCVENKSVL